MNHECVPFDDTFKHQSSIKNQGKIYRHIIVVDIYMILGQWCQGYLLIARNTALPHKFKMATIGPKMANSVCKGVYPYFLRSNQLSISLSILHCDQLQGCRLCQLTFINQSVPHHHPSLCQAVLQCSSLCSSPPPFYNKIYIINSIQILP